MSIDVNSFGKSVASLDADLVDLDDTDELVDAVFVAASNICSNREINVSEFTDLLKASLAGSDKNELAILLAKTTGVDWLYDEETEETFKLVAEKFLEGIEHYSKSS